MTQGEPGQHDAEPIPAQDTPAVNPETSAPQEAAQLTVEQKLAEAEAKVAEMQDAFFAC